MEHLSLYYQFLIIVITNFLFIYFRTLNVTANAHKDRLALFWTGLLVHLSWLVSISLGVNAVLTGNWILIVGSAAGGLYGADCAITGLFKRRV